MNSNEYEMPNQEFIRSTIESLVGIKVNEIPSQQLTKMIVKQNQELQVSPTPTNGLKDDIYITPKVEVICGAEPSHIEQDTILSLAYALLESMIKNYQLYHQDPAYALVYMKNDKLKSSKLFLFPKADINTLYYYQKTGTKPKQAKLYIYKLAEKSKGENLSIH